MLEEAKDTTDLPEATGDAGADAITAARQYRSFDMKAPLVAHGRTEGEG